VQQRAFKAQILFPILYNISDEEHIFIGLTIVVNVIKHFFFIADSPNILAGSCQQTNKKEFF
jgi:hypothetical protein